MKSETSRAPLATGNVRSSFVGRLWAALPEGRPLPELVWQRRHRGIVILLWLHVLGIVGFGLLAGSGLVHSAAECALVALAALCAGPLLRGRRLRSTVASLGLLTASAILVHLSGGYIEVHFHFFVALVIIALYQDWVPFLFAIGYVVLQHGVLGVLMPMAVYNHPDGWAHPWKWAGIHGVFVLASCIASLLNWRLNESARAHVELLLQSVGEGLAGVDRAGQFSFVNPVAARLLGWRPEDLLGRPMYPLVHHPRQDGSPYPQADWPISATLRDGVVRQSDCELFRRRDGATLPVEYICTPVYERGALVGAVIAFKDITECKRAEAALRTEAALRESEERYRSLVENSPEAIAVHCDGVFVYVNPATVALFGAATPEALLGRSILDVVHPEHHEQVRERMRQSQEERKQTPLLEQKLLCLDGQIIHAEVTDIPTTYRGRAATQVVAKDITARKSAEAQLAYQAFHDPLTALPNRALFLKRLEHALTCATTTPKKVAVLFIDLDRFKVVNDSLGHAAGDQLLTLVGQRLQSCVRASDTVARLGGDEFTVILEDIPDLEHAVQVAERIIASLQTPMLLDGHDIVIATSIGIALSEPGQDSPSDLMRNADIALYQAKGRGKARYELFDMQLDDQARQRLQREAELRRAIEREEFVVHYQPLVDLSSGQMTGVEALVRWEHPKRGQVPPAEFIPLAEETGLICPLGRWTLEAACRQMQEWSIHYPDTAPAVVSVNLSAQQLRHTNVVNEISSVLQRTGLDPRRLQLEITETVIMEDATTMMETLRALKALGVQLAIDDFGTGYSSLSYLKRFPVDVLKVDRAFVTGLGDNPEDTAIVQAVITLATILELHVTAEGVETAQQLLKLQALGCQHAQGYYFARPLSGERIDELLRGDSASILNEVYVSSSMKST